MSYPRNDSTAPATVLASYLDEARRILAQAQPVPTLDAAHVSADFDHLRWFELPAISLQS